MRVTQVRFFVLSIAGAVTFKMVMLRIMAVTPFMPQGMALFFAITAAFNAGFIWLVVGRLRTLGPKPKLSEIFLSTPRQAMRGLQIFLSSKP